MRGAWLGVRKMSSPGSPGCMVRACVGVGKTPAAGSPGCMVRGSAGKTLLATSPGLMAQRARRAAGSSDCRLRS